MPTISLNLKKLREYIKQELSLSEINKLLEYCKCEIKEIKNNEIICEVTPDRIDHFSIEGISRSIKGLLGIEKGLEKIDLFEEKFHVYIDNSLKKIRPYIVLASVRGVNLNNDALNSLINLQEILHESIGRNRKKASIGIYDLSKINGHIYYKLKKLDEIKFKPLDFSYELNGYEILNKTEKGIKYKNLILKNYAPVLLDSKGQYLSMPPIINSEDTKVTEKTKDILIDSTGFDLEFLISVVTLMVYAIKFYGGKVGMIKHYYNSNSFLPNFSYRSVSMNINEINKTLGTNFSKEKIKEYLLKARFDVSFLNGKINVKIPLYRLDILHPVDIIEDIAIIHGYENLKFEFPLLYTKGKLSFKTTLINKIKEIFIGFGFQEIINYMLCNSDFQTEFINLKSEKIGLIFLENPISKEYNCIRANLFPCILHFLSYNIAKPYPQKIFEIGDVIIYKNKIITQTKLCAAITYNEASFEDLHSCLYSFLKTFDVNFNLIANNLDFLIKGRRADIVINNNLKIGWIGEINPKILLKFNLKYPLVIFEIDLSYFLRKI